MSDFFLLFPHLAPARPSPALPDSVEPGHRLCLSLDLGCSGILALFICPELSL